MKRRTIDLRIKHDIFLEKEMFLLVNKFGADGTHILIRLWSVLASTDGWELEYDEESLDLLGYRIKADKSKIKEVIEYCTKRGNSYIRITKDNKIRSTVLEKDMLEYVIKWREKQQKERDRKKHQKENIGNKKILVGLD